jgi:hypothetical protein
MDAGQAVSGDAEQVRRAHLSHEASIKSVGVLYLLGSIFSLFCGAVTVFTGAQSLLSPDNAHGAEAMGPFELIVGGVVVGVGILLFYAGLSMRSLNPNGKTVAIAVACLGLVGIPIGTLISAYILYLLLSEKGKVVFSPEYKAIIAATPHIRYRTSIIVWIFLILLIAVVLLVIVGVGMSAMSATGRR